MEINNFKFLESWIVTFRVFSKMGVLLEKKISMIFDENESCRICDEKMSKADFLDHYRICNRIRRKTLDLCLVSDDLILFCKTFERYRREFKLKMMKEHEKTQTNKTIKPKPETQRNSSIQRLSMLQNFTVSMIKNVNKAYKIQTMKEDYQRLQILKKTLKRYKPQLEQELLSSNLDNRLMAQLIEISANLKSDATKPIRILFRDSINNIEERLNIINKLFVLQKKDHNNKFFNDLNRAKRGASLAGSIQHYAGLSSKSFKNGSKNKKMKSKMKSLFQSSKSTSRIIDSDSSEGDHEDTSLSPTNIVVDMNVTDMTVSDGTNMFIVSRSITKQRLDQRRRTKTFDLSRSPTGSPTRNRKKSGFTKSPTSSNAKGQTIIKKTEEKKEENF